jgi:ribonuclease D
VRLLTSTDELAAFCAEAAGEPYVTVDTEFLRERTYYPELCLVQLARPGRGTEGAVLVDTLADGLALDPLYELFAAPGTTKVFHAARQDLEIFYTEAGVFPEPFFDTQVAAMVCGYGDQVGYETLARQLAGASIDKSSRFTDWSRRPLSPAQLAYAAADVTHLRPIYERLSAQLKKSGRAAWVEEELALLTSPETYRSDPETAWQRLKFRSSSPRFLAALRELARMRESSPRSATCRATASSRTTPCSSSPPPARRAPRSSAARASCSARRAAARWPRRSSPRSAPPRRWTPATCPRCPIPPAAAPRGSRR